MIKRSISIIAIGSLISILGAIYQFWFEFQHKFDFNLVVDSLGLGLIGVALFSIFSIPIWLLVRYLLLGFNAESNFLKVYDFISALVYFGMCFMFGLTLAFGSAL